MVDVPSQIGAVERGLRTVEIEGAESRIQTVAQEYPAPIDEVWAACTRPERIARWFLPVSGSLHAGGHYQLEGNASGDILACEPPADGAAGYRATWEFGGGVSWIAVRLTAHGTDRTRFELEHTARVADVPPEMWETFGPGATGVGWDQALLGLALHLGAQRGSIPPSEAEAWMLSDEGRAFSRASADRWAEAHAASGADPEAAARAADATFGFYTGETP